VTQDRKLFLERLHFRHRLGDEVLVLDGHQGEVLAAEAAHLAAPEPGTVDDAAGGQRPRRGAHVPASVSARGQSGNLRREF